MLTHVDHLVILIPLTIRLQQSICVFPLVYLILLLFSHHLPMESHCSYHFPMVFLMIRHLYTSLDYDFFLHSSYGIPYFFLSFSYDGLPTGDQPTGTRLEAPWQRLPSSWPGRGAWAPGICRGDEIFFLVKGHHRYGYIYIYIIIYIIIYICKYR